MSIRQLLLFCFVLLIMTGNGVGIMTILPVYLKQLGAAPSFTGFFYALLFVALGSSAYLGGWISDRFQAHKRTSILASILITISFSGMLFAKTLPVFAIAMWLSWFLGGLHIFTVYTMVGLQAGGHERGRIFGVLAFAGNIGTIVSGFLYGWIVDRSGFSVLFIISIIIGFGWIIAASFYEKVTVPAAESVRPEKAPAVNRIFNLGMSFNALFFAVILGWIAIHSGKLGTSLSMSLLGYSTFDISRSNGIAALVTMPVPLVLGWLSDRVGRKRLLLMLNGAAVISLLILSSFQTLPGFWVASSLLSLCATIGVLSQALTVDLVPQTSLGLGLSLLTIANHIGGIIGSFLLGNGFQYLGLMETFQISLLLPGVSVILLLLIRESRLVVPATE
jgi:MFS family permease